MTTIGNVNNFKIFGKEYKSDAGNTNGAAQIQSINNEISSCLEGKKSVQSEITVQQTEMAENNEQEQEQVQQISQNLAAVQSEYSAAVSAASEASSAASQAASNASSLVSAAAATPPTIQQQTGVNEETGEPIIEEVENPAYAEAQAAAEAAQQQAEAAQQQAEAMQQQAEALQATCEEIQAEVDQINSQEQEAGAADEQKEKDEELEALKEQITEYDTQIESLREQLQQVQAQNEEIKNQQQDDNSGFAQDENSKPEVSVDAEGNSLYSALLANGATVDVKRNSDGTTEQTLTKPDGSKVIITTGENGTAISIQKEDSTQTDMEYSKDGLYSLTTNADGTYSEIGNDENGNPTFSRYSNDGQLTSTLQAVNNGNSIKYEYGVINSDTGIATVNDEDGFVYYDAETGDALSIDQVKSRQLGTDNSKDFQATQADVAEDNTPIEIIQYNRADGDRSAIMENHEGLDVLNGMQNESGISGTQIDLDKYYDKYHEGLDKATQFDDYAAAVGQDIIMDLADFYKVDLDSDSAEDDIQKIYEGIASSVGVDASAASDVYELVNAVNYKLAQMSWDGTLNNDYVDLNQIQSVASQVEEHSSGGETDVDDPISNSDGEEAEYTENEENQAEQQQSVADDELLNGKEFISGIAGTIIDAGSKLLQNNTDTSKDELTQNSGNDEILGDKGAETEKETEEISDNSNASGNILQNENGTFSVEGNESFEFSTEEQAKKAAEAIEVYKDAGFSNPTPSQKILLGDTPELNTVLQGIKEGKYANSDFSEIKELNFDTTNLDKLSETERKEFDNMREYYDIISSVGADSLGEDDLKNLETFENYMKYLYGTDTFNDNTDYLAGNLRNMCSKLGVDVRDLEITDNGTYDNNVTFESSANSDLEYNTVTGVKEKVADTSEIDSAIDRLDALVDAFEEDIETDAEQNQEVQIQEENNTAKAVADKKTAFEEVLKSDNQDEIDKAKAEYLKAIEDDIATKSEPIEANIIDHGRVQVREFEDGTTAYYQKDENGEWKPTIEYYPAKAEGNTEADAEENVQAEDSAEINSSDPWKDGTPAQQNVRNIIGEGNLEYISEWSENPDGTLSVGFTNGTHWNFDKDGNYISESNVGIENISDGEGNGIDEETVQGNLQKYFDEHPDVKIANEGKDLTWFTSSVNDGEIWAKTEDGATVKFDKEGNVKEVVLNDYNNDKNSDGTPKEETKFEGKTSNYVNPEIASALGENADNISSIQYVDNTAYVHLKGAALGFDENNNETSKAVMSGYIDEFFDESQAEAIRAYAEENNIDYQSVKCTYAEDGTVTYKFTGDNVKEGTEFTVDKQNKEVQQQGVTNEEQQAQNDAADEIDGCNSSNSKSGILPEEANSTQLSAIGNVNPDSTYEWDSNAQCVIETTKNGDKIIYSQVNTVPLYETTLERLGNYLNDRNALAKVQEECKKYENATVTYTELLPDTVTIRTEDNKLIPIKIKN